MFSVVRERTFRVGARTRLLSAMCPSGYNRFVNEHAVRARLGSGRSLSASAKRSHSSVVISGSVGGSIGDRGRFRAQKAAMKVVLR